MEPEKKANWTLDDITTAIGEIAHDESSKDRLKALGMLSKLNAGTAAVPPPISDDEVVDRLSRLMSAAGEVNCRKAMARVFVRKRPALFFESEKCSAEIEEQIKGITTLRQFYRMFPDLKRNGVPTGFPSRLGHEAHEQWVKKEARRILMERARVTTIREGIDEFEANRTEAQKE